MQSLDACLIDNRSCFWQLKPDQRCRGVNVCRLGRICRDAYVGGRRNITPELPSEEQPGVLQLKEVPR